MSGCIVGTEHYLISETWDLRCKQVLDRVLVVLAISDDVASSSEVALAEY